IKLLLWNTGYTDADDVTQPDMLWVKKGNNATINCSHRKGAGYFQMYWYRQLPGETMKLVVFTTSTKLDFEPDFRDGRFSATKPDAHSGTLTVKDLVADDKGLYFCAMYWYRQLPGETMKLVVFTTSTKLDFEPDFRDGRFSATKPDAHSGTLTVKDLVADDKGLYFCAVPLKPTESSKLLLTSFRELVNLLPAGSTVHIKYQVIKIFSGYTDADDVTQPDMLWVKKGNNATINCSHRKGAGYFQMYWYRQLPGETMELIVFTSSASKDHDFGKFRKEKFSATKPDAESGTLTVKDLVADDKGLYFCAMYWYRQLPGETMELIVFTSSASKDHDFGKFRDGRFSATKPDAESGTLTVKDLVADDKGLYFCAVPLKPTESSKLLLTSFRELVNLLPAGSTVHIKYQVIKIFSGYTDADVTQPDMLWVKKGNNATINCSHTKGATYYQMYWYRQLPGETMKLVVFTTSTKPDFEPDFRDGRFSATKPDAHSGTLTVKDLVADDKGLYFCAVSEHSDTDTCSTDGSQVTQTSLLWKYKDQSATMNCSHTKDSSYRQMYWYRQRPGEGMKQIVFTTSYSSPQYESDFSEDKFPAQKKAPQNGSLTVNKLLPEDSGVYFCSVSKHSDTGSSLSDQVNQTPAEIYKKPGGTAKISCSHSIQDYNRILWYKQTNGQLQFLGYMNQKEDGQLQFLGYMFMSTGYPEEGVKMYWYRQRPGETMTLIVNTAFGVPPDYAGTPGTKYSAKKEKIESGALTVNDLQPEDSGVYFCAVSKHGVCLSVQVHQTPPALLRRPGDKVQLVCSHEKTDYSVMYWYQKSPGDRSLKRIGHVYYSRIEHEESFKEHFNITGDMSGSTAKNGSLFIADLKAPEHSACLGVEVRQSPPDLITKVGDKVQIFCTHDKTDYRTMLWYQQSPGDTAMKLIGYLNYKAVTMETLYEADFNITGDLTVNTAKNGSLITKATRPEQAVYYCAASACLGVEVRQSASDLITKVGDNVHIFCTHDKTDYRMMFWYQQSPGDTAMKLIGYLYFKAVTMEKLYEKQFIISGDLGVSCLSLEVRQSASDLITKPGGEVQIFCTHDKTDYRMMLWYQQSPGDTAMELIGYLYFKAVTMEKLYKADFNITGDLSGSTAKNGSLILKRVEHSAVYYCAAREAR
ncbi:Immunoglobulin lambda variable 2-18, partial [Nibea albiflora]